MTSAESLLAYFDANDVKCELVDGRVRLTGARRVPADVIARARRSRDEIASLIASRRDCRQQGNCRPRPLEKHVPPEARALSQQLANERNLAAERRGGCDRYCACQSLARLQWRDRRTGRLLWICDDCLDPATVSGPIISSRSWNTRRKPAPPAIELRHVRPPDECVRDRWWEQPVHGWADGRLILRNMIRDACVEIELRSTPA